MDRGIWATWYDLAEDGREDYFAWLHGTHLPALMVRPGYLWAASYEVQDSGPPRGGVYDPETHGVGLGGGRDLGTGSQFIQLVGAAEPQVFFNPSLDVIPEIVNDEAKAMIARRQGVRSAILLEEARVNGPEIRLRPVATAPGPVIQLGALRLTSLGAQFTLGAWYAQDRMMAMTRLPGAVAMRKCAVVAGWAKHAPLYEFASIEARNEIFARLGEGQTEEHRRLEKATMSQTLHAPGSPSLAIRIWPD
jgi:hypothetical protein